MNIKGWDERLVWEMQGFGNVSRNGLRVGTKLRPTSRRYSPAIGGLDAPKYIGYAEPSDIDEPYPAPEGYEWVETDDSDDLGDLAGKKKSWAKKLKKKLKKLAPILKVVAGVAVGVGVLSLAQKAAATAKKAAAAKKAASALKKSKNAAAAQEAEVDAEAAVEENAEAEEALTMEVGKESAMTGRDPNVIRTVATTQAAKQMASKTGGKLVLPLAIGGGVLVIGLILFLSLRKK